MTEGRRAFSPAAVAALFIAALGAWAATHPYHGIGHDGTLYAFQAIATGDLAHLKGDLYLRYGSQDAYTLFSPLYRAFIAALGLEYGTMALVLIGQAAWLTGAWLLLRRLLGSAGAAALALVFVAAIDPKYSHAGALGFGEGFATPRLFAEALSLMMLAALADRRWALAGGAFLLTGALHPLVAAVSAAIAFFGLSLADRRWLWLLAPGLFGVAALALTGAGPFAGAFTALDAEWRAVVAARSPHVFAELWPRATWLVLAVDALILVAAARVSGQLGRRFFLAALVAIPLGVAVTWIGVDRLGNVLLAQVQPWRIVWLSHVAALAGLGVLLISARAPAERLSALALALILAAAEFAPVMKHGAVLAAALHLLILFIPPGADWSKPARSLAAGAALALAVFAALAASEQLDALIAFDAEGFARVGGSGWRRELAALAAILIAVLLAASGGRLAGRIAAPLAALILAFGTAHWDARTPWRVAVEGAPGTFGGETLAGQGTVLWQGGASAATVWFGLYRPAWISREQGAGVVFNRETAMEYARRQALAAPVTGGDAPPTARARPPVPKAEDIGRLCAEPDAPAMIVLDTPVKGLDSEVWAAPAPDIRFYYAEPPGRRVRLVETYHLYRCGPPSAAKFNS